MGHWWGDALVVHWWWGEMTFGGALHPTANVLEHVLGRTECRVLFTVARARPSHPARSDASTGSLVCARWRRALAL